MKHLSLDALRAFVTVFDLQSYTKAAERMSRSQPAISLQIKRLEDLLNQSLIVREGTSIKLTAAGLDLYQGALPLLAQHDQLMGRFATEQVTGQVRLGIPSEFAPLFCPVILGQISRAVILK